MIALYDRFTHDGSLTRRDLMDGLTRLAGSSAAALAILPFIEASASAASRTRPDEPGIISQRIQWRSDSGRTMFGYLAMPESGVARARKVMVIHENRGLNEHIRDVTRRLALSGMVALAPDFLSAAGETPRTGDGTNSADDIARAMIGQLDRGMAVSDALSALMFLDSYSTGRGRPKAMGFCWGGGMVNQLAVAAASKLDSGIVYYGPPADPADAGRIKARMLYHYAGLDTRINAMVPPWEAALKSAGVGFESHVYAGVNHAFNNDTSEARYNASAASLAWSRSLALLAS
ncbi:dienelactone hydrolase family protein [Sandarakinorhabdus sp.]|uniref:dienelactone hydrolase family protein n=1 Tax=Sandarakinorhabdus sp. TaxID=1916663 RepID=UPI00286DF8D3|nr:dienelactone hydrolase family protein [Sandarakinorhabdus sp.]